MKLDKDYLNICRVPNKKNSTNLMIAETCPAESSSSSVELSEYVAELIPGSAEFPKNSAKKANLVVRNQC